MNNQKSETVQQVSIPWEGETWKARGPKKKRMILVWQQAQNFPTPEVPQQDQDSLRTMFSLTLAEERPLI